MPCFLFGLFCSVLNSFVLIAEGFLDFVRTFWFCGVFLCMVSWLKHFLCSVLISYFCHIFRNLFARIHINLFCLCWFLIEKLEFRLLLFDILSFYAGYFGILNPMATILFSTRMKKVLMLFG
ncbi:hypothetical protein TorRG33x02_307470 [Trema orientale]|uniref:Uncharacterized protein n=1 Tax=Trema orientale TaxID=63057 RepID=A0A2P5BV90_TREOI|nr:hypothetical protein TorRG33x02_307470 [Trema orientale]